MCLNLFCSRSHLKQSRPFIQPSYTCGPNSVRSTPPPLTSGVWHFDFPLSLKRHDPAWLSGGAWFRLLPSVLQGCEANVTFRYIQNSHHALKRTRTHYSSSDSTLHRLRSATTAETIREQLPFQLTRQYDQFKQRQQDQSSSRWCWVSL